MLQDYQLIDALVDAKKDIFFKLSDQIWDTPELYWREYKSSATLAGALKNEGFTVQEGVNGIPTAFIGSWGHGSPVIGFLGEFDALAQLSQQRGVASPSPVVEGAPGHGCGHNGMGSGALAAAVAFKDFLKESGLNATVRYYGCPAEEAGWSKMFLARDGYFSDLDAALTWHPWHYTGPLNISTQANICARFSFSGKASHAASAPHMGRSALDACELMSVGVNYLREHITSDARVHYAYQDAGGSSPNIVQQHASVKYFIRAKNVVDAKDIAQRIKDIAAGAALMTSTAVNSEFLGGMCEYLPNRVLGKAAARALDVIGPPRFTAADRALAQSFYDKLSPGDIAASNGMMAAAGPQAALYRDKVLMDGVFPFNPSGETALGSTDVGDISHCVPTMQLHVAAFANGTPFHTWMLTAQSGTPLMHRAIEAAAKALSLTAVSLVRNPKMIDQAKEELRCSTGGIYVCPVGPEAVPCII